MEKKDKNYTLVSVLGNKNTGKSFILSKISKIEIPDGFNISTIGLSIIYPEYDEGGVIFLDTLGVEGPLCEDDRFFNFEIYDKERREIYEEKKYKLENENKKDYINEEEYNIQIKKFINDKKLTNEFIKKFVTYYSNLNIYVVDSVLDLKEQNFYKYFLDEKINIIVHNLKTLRQIREVEDYINEYFLKSVPFQIEKNFFTKVEKLIENGNDKYNNNVYYKQIICDNKNAQIIHLFMANENSEE